MNLRRYLWLHVELFGEIRKSHPGTPQPRAGLETFTTQQLSRSAFFPSPSPLPSCLISFLLFIHSATVKKHSCLEKYLVSDKEDNQE